MGRKRGGGGGGANRSSFDCILLGRIESASKSCATVEQLVDQLRSRYVDYVRQKRQPFIRRVESIFRSISRRNDAVGDSSDYGDTPITKKRRITDEKEEKLQLIEAQHLMNRSGDVSNNGGGCGGSSSSVVASASSLEKEGDEVSTSSAEFDLMKSMVRENLSRKAKRLRKGKEVKEDMDMEIVDNKGVKNVNLVNEIKGKLGDFRSKMNKNDNNGVKGPMFKDLGGMSGVVEKLMMRVIVPLHTSQLRPQHELGMKPSMGGILLHGPPGCGKTKLAQAIANETGLAFYQICAAELVSGVSGASEENIRELFSKACRTAPSIVFIDEIDAIASKRENTQKGMEQRIVTQLMTCMSENSGSVLVIGATNRPDAIDGALRRPGRLNREIFLGVPDESARVEILAVLTRNLKIEDDFDVLKIARSTPGFVGADLEGLVNEACIIAMDRILYERKAEFSKRKTNMDDSDDWWKKPWTDEEIKKLFITVNDFEEAVKIVQPSSKREGFSAIPTETWDDVGGYSSLRQEFDRYLVRPIKFPKDHEDNGMDLSTGFLLYGPPGCGKTLIAKAVANEAGANFIHIKGPELLNKYVGETESRVREIFSRARTCSPCIIFFDEVDALTTKRGTEGGWVVERVLTTLLTEMDGGEPRQGVYVIGTTNRRDVIDPALLRPGRFGKLLYVALPTPDERGMILKTLARKKSIDADVDLMALGRDSACENFSCADLKQLMNVATVIAMEEKQNSPSKSSDGPSIIKNEHLRKALEEERLRKLEKVSPSFEQGNTILQSFV